MRWLLLTAITAYRIIWRALVPGGCCRFVPSCSTYAKEALEQHHWLIAVRLILKRLLRCHPFGGSGYDPIPPVDSRSPHQPQEHCAACSTIINKTTIRN